MPLIFFLLLFSYPALSLEPISNGKEKNGLYTAIKQELSLKATLQAGFEWDSNVFKTFNSSRDDFLARALFKLDGKKTLSKKDRLSANYFVGGKKFFSLNEQDTIIQQCDVNYLHLFQAKNRLIFDSRFKIQNERNKRDDSGEDINEDYLLTNAHLTFIQLLPLNIKLSAKGLVELFRFGDDAAYDYFRQRYRLQLRRKLYRPLSVGIHYAYARQHFEQQDRHDQLHGGGIDFQYYKQLLLKVGYNYQFNFSPGDFYQYQNHRFDLLATIPISLSSYTIILNILGRIQLKRYPAVYRRDEEEQRLLLTDAEAENLNSLVAKLTGRIVKNLNWELKYSYYGNELLYHENTFSRQILHAGLRLEF